ncbi:hypothetical protein EMCG_03965 [[Emmonsia] crescens]|uniref:Metallo-beta-lactamase domain-containing protein n=1 Tax=[Emmonsia] crescens TaxID=73230 RepID=A0A0G2IZF6_9EURO|nr:hypothetical protein EMCG_03965 [Emmonsia crescens UAMH 3008]
MTDIDGVIFAHLHYDHVRGPSRFSGPPTKFIIGPGTTEALLSGPNTYPTNKESIFDSNILPRSRTVELPFPSSPPFPAAMDYFGDGFVFIVNAPGHLAGYLNLLVRVGTGKRMYLVGDTAHDVRGYKGTRELAAYPDPKKVDHLTCAHADKEAAHEHM